MVPRWLTARDEVWLRELAAEIQASDGRRQGDVAERILEIVSPIARRHGVGRRTIEALWLVERRRWKTRVDAPLPPEQIRRAVFDLAAERSREEALAAAAAELGIDVGAIEGALFADREHARRLVAPAVACVAADLASGYNLALVQALLVRATQVVALVRGNLRGVVGYAKLLGLMATFDTEADGAVRMTVSGPLALFHDTLKYGRALARWFPSVVATPGWRVEATVLLDGEPARLLLDGSAPLPRTHTLPRAHDSRIEARLDRDLRRLGGKWRVERESAVVPSRGRLFFPDFALVSDLGRVLVEVVGFWTPDYLAKKRELLESAKVPLVMCVDERHAHGELAESPLVLTFKRFVDAAALVDICERVLATTSAPQARLRRYSMVIMRSRAIERYAVRAGANPASWHKEVFADLTRDRRLRYCVLGNHSVYGLQVGLVGSTFYAEAAVDRDRKRLVVHRVGPVTNRPHGAMREHEGEFELAVPH